MRGDLLHAPLLAFGGLLALLDALRLGDKSLQSLHAHVVFALCVSVSKFLLFMRARVILEFEFHLIPV